ncbi:MAG: ribosome maturation factor RimP [Thermodesulfovibrionales bacterium]|nr:ribosome maturation factor RimP [Thermodesulfovibrionales bacterium]
MSTTIEKIQQLAHSIAEEVGFEVVKIELLGKGKKTLLRVFIDKTGGVTIGDCEYFSRRLESLLDVEDLIQSSYLLEVSSPGMNRALKDLRDFQKQIGKLIRITTKDKIDNQTFFVGRLVEVGDDWIRILLEDRKVPKFIFIPFNLISKSQLEIEIK